MTDNLESLNLIEPMLPSEGTRVLEDLATDLIAKSNGLSTLINPALAMSLGDLVRSMNCYYSNLIEGHRTHPRDIDRALADDFVSEPRQRSLQLEAKAHIEVQRLIDLHGLSDKENSSINVVSANYIKWIHEQFCQRLPNNLRLVENPQTGFQIQIIPGEFRTGGVKVGGHIPISAGAIPRFLKRFEEAYNWQKMSKVRQVIAVAASHHRLLWIHPFYDGNGRVARLFSHAFLKQIGIGSGLWSVSRGLARSLEDYRRYLMEADQPRWNDLDGRGNLSARGLNQFCQFFLEVCLDQVEYMRGLIEPEQLLNRIELYVEEKIRLKQLPKRSFSLLKEAVLIGKFDRGKAAQITGYKERQARTVLNQLVKAGLLVSDTPRGSVRLGFPSLVQQRYFPSLYPEKY
jgi:Fic family protein